MKVKIKDAFILQMGKTPARKNIEFWENGIYKWLSIGDFNNYRKYVTDTKEKISERAVTETGIKIVPENVVVMSFKLSIGKAAITTEPIYTNEAIMAFLPKPFFELLPDYLYYLVSYKDWQKETNRAVMGSTLNKAILGEIEITIPEFAVQKNVAKILDKIENLIDKTKYQLEKLDQLVKSRYFGEVVA